MSLVLGLALPLTLFGGCASKITNEGKGFEVNPFLWRASLEVISFMPLSFVNPTGGVISTEWLTEKNERFKLTVYILDSGLRADGLRVAVFRQTRSGGRWLTAEANFSLRRRIENLILTRARALRLGYEAAR